MDVQVNLPHQIIFVKVMETKDILQQKVLSTNLNLNTGV